MTWPHFISSHGLIAIENYMLPLFMQDFSFAPAVPERAYYHYYFTIGYFVNRH